jgi:prolipoprotein diacylglyceryltransferase
MLMFAVDYLVMGHKVRDPVQLYHWVAFGVYFVIVITVASLIDRMKKKAAIQIAHENADGHSATERPL